MKIFSFKLRFKSDFGYKIENENESESERSCSQFFFILILFPDFLQKINIQLTQQLSFFTSFVNATAASFIPSDKVK